MASVKAGTGAALCTAALCTAALVAAMSGCASGKASPRSATSPCHAVGRVNDQLIATVGDARTWGPVARGEHRYPGYADTDRLAVCLQPDGTAVGIFLKDGHRQVLWHQSPADKIRLPI